MTCTMMHFSVSCFLEMASKNYWTDVYSVLPMPKIQELVLFLAGNTWLHEMFFYLYMYDVLWCSQYCVTIPMGLSLGGRLTLPSNISYFIKPCSEISIFNVVRVEIFVTSISSEPGDHTLQYLLLCSSNFADEHYLSFLVCWSHHFIIALLFV